jgi:uncharacterized protein
MKWSQWRYAIAAVLFMPLSHADDAAPQKDVWRCIEAGDKSFYTNQERDTRGKNCIKVKREVSVVPAFRIPDAPRTGRPRATPAPGVPASDPDEGRLERAFGSGFVVSTKGEILTNAHLIHECRGVRVRTGDKDEPQKATVIAKDRENDLAVIRIERPWGEPATLRADTPLQTGETVWVLGYPLTGLLAAELNITQGIVSAGAGVRGDPKKVQITNPIQTGNSGGPLLDHSGQVVGVVAGKLNALKIAQMTGELPQNVNFAIKVETVARFLSAAQIPFVRAASRGPVEGVALVRDARKYTVLIECEA